MGELEVKLEARIKQLEEEIVEQEQRLYTLMARVDEQQVLLSDLLSRK